MWIVNLLASDPLRKRAMELAASLLCGRPQASLAEIGNRGADQGRLSPQTSRSRSIFLQLAGH